MTFELITLKSPKGRIVPVKRELTSRRTHGGLCVRAIVIHVAQTPEVSQAAENLADWDAGPQKPKASWHFACDDDSTTQSVLCEDIAWHSGPMNPWSIGIEHAGSAYQTDEQWHDRFSELTLARSAGLAAYLCEVYDVPVRHVSVDELRYWYHHKGPLPCGIIGHNDVTHAIAGNHKDPGPNFPWAEYLRRIAVL